MALSTLAPAEIEFVASFLIELLPPTLNQALVSAALADRLHARFVPHHWHPLEPERGSGFRAISHEPSRQDGYVDPVLALLAQLLAVSPRQLRRLIARHPSDIHQSGWTLWCDPGCVSIRAQAGGGELRELWGALPPRLGHLRLCSGGVSPPAPRSPLHVAGSPSKSRAIPILAPSSAVRLAGVSALAVTPPTPSGPVRCPAACAMDGDAEDCIPELTRPLGLTRRAHEDEPFLRPCSRTSCASSSSSGSDHSGFSASSSSTATSVAPGAAILGQKAGEPRAQLHAPATGFTRHHSTSSLPYVSLRPVTPATLVPLGARAASPAVPNARRKHAPSASVSSLGAGRGLLVLKEGPGTVTEHSGGKVGVMGGGVLLGLPKDNGHQKENGGHSHMVTAGRRVGHNHVRRNARTCGSGSGNF